MHRSPWRTITALAAGLTLTASAAVPAAASAGAGRHPDPSTPVERTVAAMQPGWNLGNTLDALGDDETAWGNPHITRELLESVSAQGFNSIRLPVTWGQHQGGSPDYLVEPAFMDRVNEVVDWALDADLYVLLDVHHDSWIWLNQYPNNRDEVDAQYVALWEQIADRFADHPQTLLFESINEPQFAGGVDSATGDALLHEQNVTFHEIVRSSGGNNADRVLVLPTLHTNDEQPRLDALAETIESLDDPNLVATTHSYGYWPFSVNVAGGTRFDADAQQHLRDSFARLHETFVARGVPVIMGEYGLLGFDRHTGTIQQGEKLKFFEELGYLARTSGVTTMLWDNGQHLDRTALTWKDPDLYRYISTSWTVRSGVASTDQVFVRPADVVAQTITLDPHGHQFTGLRAGKSQLNRNKDYTISGNELTLSPALLQRLLGSGEHGVRAELELRFSRGLPWRVEIISADTPVLQDATGATDAFAVPTAFHGDRLATMEATYVDDGSNAGPHSWTPFKEFDAAFAPDTAAGQIILRPRFFDDVADQRPVELTFHFWSGDKLTYTIVRDGTTVTGTAT
ncbi:cellulase family glycosylhydrolase [Isoptericola croceus]|uniref:cellulase family glycosylhydrolase n=1 Tax=Isoptericola croceus TaxID=3031406 RepID=UPI0023F75335|nr:cellulase family glycosylhydrolase [Isoptericola croceus]